MKSKDTKAFLGALEELERDKGISKEELLSAVEQALIAAYKKNYGEEENVKVSIDRESGEVNVYESKTVVENDKINDEFTQITLEEAKKLKKRIKVGDVIKKEVDCESFRRNAIQNGKQIIIQKVREAERENIYNKFKVKEETIMVGIIRRIDEKKNVFIEFDGLETILTPAEQSPSDLYRVGDRIKVYLSEVEKTNKFPKIVISRKNEGLLRKLFELEIPEISSGMIEIKALAREAGSRAKVAVHSNLANIDIVGACVGQKGLRIKNIVEELNGEKIDIVIWKEEMAEFVSAVLSPAQIKSVEILDEARTAKVLVDESQLSLAIGKNGQNARLAAKLTDIRIDIKTNLDGENSEE